MKIYIKNIRDNKMILFFELIGSNAEFKINISDVKLNDLNVDKHTNNVLKYIKANLSKIFDFYVSKNNIYITNENENNIYYIYSNDSLTPFKFEIIYNMELYTFSIFIIENGKIVVSDIYKRFSIIDDIKYNLKLLETCYNTQNKYNVLKFIEDELTERKN